MIPQVSAQSLPEVCAVPWLGLTSTDLLILRCTREVSRAAEVAENQRHWQARALVV